MKFINLLVLLTTLQSRAHQISTQSETVLTSLDQAQALGAVILSKDQSTNTAVAYLTQLQLNQLSDLNHARGKCAGFETLSKTEAQQPGLLIENLKRNQLRMESSGRLRAATVLNWNADYQKWADLANPESLRETVKWISSYPNRYNKAPNPNRHVEDLKLKLESILAGAAWPFDIELISHQSTPQKTLHLTITGKSHPNEFVVLGAHLDSINRSYFGNTDSAPGADDNASGSSNLIEALKILKAAPQPERTLEFYWYAGEESGLLGSAEIAQDAKAKNKNVIAVMQLDMTLFPGSGEQTIGLMNDFTSPWLREVLTAINSTYVKARFIEGSCGYGCSDHASWHRQGFNAVIPFEATLETMNKNLHTENDLIDANSSFHHSNSFTKFAILFALVLGNSDLKAPGF